MANIASNMSLGVANVANNMSKVDYIFSLPCIIHREAEFKSFQASWAFVRLGHSPPERGLLIVSTIIKYVREIKTDVSAKPPNLWMLHVAGSCNTNNNKLLCKYIAKSTMAIVDR